jgi:hypothetical protein
MRRELIHTRARRQNVSTIMKKAVMVPDTLRNKFVKLVNKLITHPRDDEGDYGIRVLLHIPIGLLMGIPVIGYQLMRLFFFYEKNEDRWTSDEAWKDTAGALLGMSLTIIATTGLGIWALVHYL